MNEIGKTVYPVSGTILENSKRKMAAEKALAAIEKELPEKAFTCEIIEDILRVAKDIIYTKPLH